MIGAADRLRAFLLPSIDSVGAEAWDALEHGDAPVTGHAWLRCLESGGLRAGDGGPDRVPRHLVVQDDDGLVAACPLYERRSEAGEFVPSAGPREIAHGLGLRWGPRGHVGPVWTPVAGPRLLGRPGGDPAYLRGLGTMLENLAGELGWSSVDLPFCAEGEAAMLGARGWVRRWTAQAVWERGDAGDFEDWLRRLTRKRRSMIRRELRRTDELGLRIEVVPGEEADEELVGRVADLVAATAARHGQSPPGLDEAFFDEAARRLRGPGRFVVARAGTALVAAAWFVRGAEGLYGRAYGCVEPVPLLHFRLTLYEGIRLAFREGLLRFEPGHGGESKDRRGMPVRLIPSMHWYPDERLRAAVRRWAAMERRAYERWARERRARSGLRG